MTKSFKLKIAAMPATSLFHLEQWLKNSLLLLLLLAIAHTAQAVAVEDVKEYLQGYEWKLQPERFLKLGEGTDVALMQIVQSNEEMPNFYRMRALEALRLFPNETVGNFLEAYLKTTVDNSIKKRALASFSHAFAEKQALRVQAAAEAFLTDTDPHMRIAAARTLRKIKTAPAQSRLKRHVTSESEDWIRQAIEAP